MGYSCTLTYDISDDDDADSTDDVDGDNRHK